MNRAKTRKIIITALMAAMACVATMVIKIPISATGGYINLGDSIVILSGIVLGPIYGGIAAGLGSALADVLSGYVIFAPATFIIKMLMAVAVAYIVKNIDRIKLPRFLIAGVIAEVIMIVGYFAFEATFMGYGIAAAGGILGNTIQGAAGIIIAAILLPVVNNQRGNDK